MFSLPRGFVIATDGLIALVILFTIVSLAFDVSSRQGQEIDQRTNLQLFAQRAVESLEKTQLATRAAITNNSTEIRTAINAWPNSVCGRVELFASPDTNLPLLLVTKSGCDTPIIRMETVRRGFMVPSPPDANLYVMEVSTWAKEG